MLLAENKICSGFVAELLLYLKELGKMEVFNEQQSEDIKKFSRWASVQKVEQSPQFRNYDEKGLPVWVFRSSEVFDNQFIDPEVT